MRVLLTTLVALALIAGGTYAAFEYLKDPICPHDFDDLEEKKAALDAWTNAFYDARPDASLGDWARARHQFYIDNECTEALERYEQAERGEADPETMQKIRNSLQEAADE